MQSRNMRNRDLEFSYLFENANTVTPYFKQDTFCSTSMVTPILCRTRLILPVWSPLYYAEHVLFYQYGYPVLCRTRVSTSQPYQMKFIKVPSHAQHRAVVCQACKEHNATRIIDISPMLWICQTTIDELH